MTNELLTVRDYLRYAVSRFRAARLVHGHGTSRVLDEAAFIVLETLHLPIDDINPWLDARLLADERKALTDVIEARVKTRKPAAYLLKKTYLQGLSFYVDERVIVPRSFIAEILAKDVEAVVPNAGEVETVLDICTGSGCLAVLAATIFGDAKVTATDLSRDALDVAKINVTDHEMVDRIELLHGDLFAPLQGRKFDLIIANPPYVAKGEVDAFSPEYRAEPVMAHIGGDDGLDLVRKIIAQAPKHLAKGGTLICEIGTGRHLLEAGLRNTELMWLDTEESSGEVFVMRG
jgi:ribosomal protein L3 glutamine methyltransferase